MTFDQTIRTTHRWLSIVFTVAALINIAAVIMQVQAQWIGLLAAVPLIPMLITGLYMFFQPYLRRKTRPDQI
ncbi:MAG TPA: hypothetical protein VN042_14010 [Asticcacaulis sp.]|nr:hypothetical protein [Asticcacaulis sp.]